MVRLPFAALVAALVLASTTAVAPRPGHAASEATPSPTPDTHQPPEPLLSPVGADEAGRRQALAELRLTQRTAKAAERELRAAQRRLRPLDAAVVEADAAVASLRARQEEVVAQLLAVRSRMRELAVATYITGGSPPQIGYLLNAGDHDELVRRHALVDSANAAKRRTAEEYTALSEAVSTELRTALDRADHAQARQAQARSEVAAAEQQLARAEAEVEHRRLLLDLVAAGAPVPPSDIPRLVLDAYQRAASTLAGRRPGCRLTWPMLAALGSIESNHGRYRGARFALNGDVHPRITGIPLDGTNGTRRITDTDDGRYDGDPELDRAVGPMQFIPSTWVRLAQDGNLDGVADPNNIYDATLTAGVYLCRPGAPLDQEPTLRARFFAYNHSDAYVQLAWERYQRYALLGL